MRTPSILIASAGLVLAMAMPSSADTVGASPSATGQHCVATAQDLQSGAEAAPTRCYSTYAEAIAVATAAGSVIGIEYDRKTFGGWSYVIVADEQACTDGHTYGIPRLPADRNDKISSARSYAGCHSVHYSRADYKGDRVSCGCSTMHAMNDRTTSILFTAR